MSGHWPGGIFCFPSPTCHGHRLCSLSARGSALPRHPARSPWLGVGAHLQAEPSVSPLSLPALSPLASQPGVFGWEQVHWTVHCVVCGCVDPITHSEQRRVLMKPVIFSASLWSSQSLLCLRLQPAPYSTPWWGHTDTHLALCWKYGGRCAAGRKLEDTHTVESTVQTPPPSTLTVAYVSLSDWKYWVLLWKAIHTRIAF